MGLVSYTNLEDGNPAGANDINQRFGDILGQLNGNLDAQNIRNGSLTRELFTQDALSAAWPVNSVYISVEDVNPGSTIGGQWVKFGEGKALVGVDPSDSNLDDAEKTFGTKNETLTTNQIPAHNHTGTTNTTGNHTHGIHNSGNHAHHLSSILDNLGGGSTNNALTSYPGANVRIASRDTTASGNHSHGMNAAGNHSHSFTTANRGGGQSHNNMQPSIAVYLWKRIS